MNKRQKEVYERWLASYDYSLYDAYDRFSEAKAEAWKYCEERKKEKCGHGLKVIGANSCFFSAGFEFEEEGANKFMYITHTDDYVWEVEE